MKATLFPLAILIVTIVSNSFSFSQKNEVFETRGINELSNYRRGESKKEVKKIDSVLNKLCDSLKVPKSRHEILYYCFDNARGVNSYEIVRFDDSIGTKLSYCWISKKIKQSSFDVHELKKYFSDRRSFNGKFSYEAGYSSDSYRYLVFKENDEVIFCGISYFSKSHNNFVSNNFINVYLNKVESECK